MTVNFISLIGESLKLSPETNAREFADNFIFDLGHVMGKSDAKWYKNQLGPKPPVTYMSFLGPQLSYSGIYKINNYDA